MFSAKSNKDYLLHLLNHSPLKPDLLKFKVNRNTKKKKTLGQGAFGYVFHGSYNNNIEVAMKRAKSQSDINQMLGGTTTMQEVEDGLVWEVSF